MSNYIYSIKLYITHFCPLRCRYCFVDNKDSIETFETKSFDHIKNIFIKYWWKVKNLYIMWWEPLFKQDILINIIKYFKNIDWLNIIIVTSWIYRINSEIINYLNFCDNIKISFSIDWTKKIHNLNRVLLNWWDSWNIVKNNISNFIQNNKNDYNFYWVITVDNNINIISQIYKMFLNLNKNDWFKLIHIWDVDWNYWENDKKLEYVKQLSYILKFIYNKHLKWEYIYLSLFSRYLVRNNSFIISKNDFFLLNSLKMLDIDTNWNIWIPFEMLSWKEKNISSIYYDTYLIDIENFLFNHKWWVKVLSWQDINLFVYKLFHFYKDKFSEKYLENILKYNLYI